MLKVNDSTYLVKENELKPDEKGFATLTIDVKVDMNNLKDIEGSKYYLYYAPVLFVTLNKGTKYKNLTLIECGHEWGWQILHHRFQDALKKEQEASGKGAV